MATVGENAAAIAALQADSTSLKENLDIFFLVTMGMVIFLMQCGFAFLEAGSVRSKNTSNILIKNLLDSCVAGIAYWLLGYGFAYGDGNKFIGWHNFATDEMDNTQLASFFFQYVFAATTATIVSGALAERCEFFAYFVYSFVLTSFIYPVVTHWVWTSEGWLAVGDDYHIDGMNVTVNFTDFAGSGCVHTVGGVAALVGAIILGPRIGRFHIDSGKSISLRGHSTPFAALGGFILLFGFVAFNAGSQLAISNAGDGGVVALAAVNTIISASAAAFMSLFINKIGIMGGTTWSLLSTINGALGGMVSICAGCNVIRPWGALIVGLVAGVAVNFTSWAMTKLHIDDPLDAVAVHFAGGVWGVLSVAFLYENKGILYNGDRESGLLLGWQLAGLITIIAWTAVLCIIMFGILKRLGVFRVSEEMERNGLDIPKQGEPAYPLESYGHGYLENIIILNNEGNLVNRKQGYINEALTDDGNYENGDRKRMNYDNPIVQETPVAPGNGHSTNGRPKATAAAPAAQTTNM